MMNDDMPSRRTRVALGLFSCGLLVGEIKQETRTEESPSDVSIAISTHLRWSRNAFAHR